MATVNNTAMNILCKSLCTGTTQRDGMALLFHITRGKEILFLGLFGENRLTSGAEGVIVLPTARVLCSCIFCVL